MKKGIALLITIGFITVLTALLGYMFAISKKSFDEVNKIESKNQSFIMFKDIKTILDRYTFDIKDSDDLSKFLLGLNPFYIHSKKNKLSLDIKIEPNDKISLLPPVCGG